jgi:hypothetical protein
MDRRAEWLRGSFTSSLHLRSERAKEIQRLPGGPAPQQATVNHLIPPSKKRRLLRLPTVAASVISGTVWETLARIGGLKCADISLI